MRQKSICNSPITPRLHCYFRALVQINLGFISYIIWMDSSGEIKFQYYTFLYIVLFLQGLFWRLVPKPPCWASSCSEPACFRSSEGETVVALGFKAIIPVDTMYGEEKQFQRQKRGGRLTWRHSTDIIKREPDIKWKTLGKRHIRPKGCLSLDRHAVCLSAT